MRQSELTLCCINIFFFSFFFQQQMKWAELSCVELESWYKNNNDAVIFTLAPFSVINSTCVSVCKSGKNIQLLISLPLLQCAFATIGLRYSMQNRIHLVAVSASFFFYHATWVRKVCLTRVALMSWQVCVCVCCKKKIFDKNVLIIFFLVFFC